MLVAIFVCPCVHNIFTFVKLELTDTDTHTQTAWVNNGFIPNLLEKDIMNYQKLLFDILQQ